MNKKLDVFVAGISALALVLVVGPPAYAVANREAPASNDRAQTTQLAQQEPAGTSDQEAETREERVQKRKDLFKTKLTNAQKTRLQSRCKNSQGLLRSVEGRIKGIETSRGQVYSNLVDRLTKLSDKLEDKGLDTAALDANIETLQEKIDNFNTNLVNYKLAVADLASMDCAVDPDGFKASLEEARTLRQTLRQSGQDIKDFVKASIKPALIELRRQLGGTTTESTDDADNSSSDSNENENENETEGDGGSE